MLKTLFTISNFEISTLVGFSVFSVIVFLAILWFLRYREEEKENKIRDEDSFDIALSGVLVGLLIIRVVGFSLNISGYEIEDVFDFIASFAKFWDGHLYYPLLPLGIVVGSWLSVLTKRRIKDTKALLDRVAQAAIPAHIVFVVGTFLSGTYFGKEYGGILTLTYTEDKIGRFPIQLIEIIALVTLLTIAMSSSLRAKKGLVSGLYLLIWGLVQFLLRFMASDFTTENGSLDFGHIVAVLMILFSLLLFPVKKINKEQQETQEKRRIFKQRGEASMKEGRERGGYNVSYGVRGGWKERTTGLFNRTKKEK